MIDSLFPFQTAALCNKLLWLLENRPYVKTFQDGSNCEVPDSNRSIETKIDFWESRSAGVFSMKTPHFPKGYFALRTEQVSHVFLDSWRLWCFFCSKQEVKHTQELFHICGRRFVIVRSMKNYSQFSSASDFFPAMKGGKFLSEARNFALRYEVIMFFFHNRWQTTFCLVHQRGIFQVRFLQKKTKFFNIMLNTDSNMTTPSRLCSFLSGYFNNLSK